MLVVQKHASIFPSWSILYNLPTYHTLFVKFHPETPVSTRNHTGSSDSLRRKKNIRQLRTYKLDALRKIRRICQPRLFHDLDLGRVSLIWMKRKNMKEPPQVIIQWHSPSWNESWKNINQVGISFRSESVTNSSISAGGGIYVIFIPLGIGAPLQSALFPLHLPNFIWKFEYANLPSLPNVLQSQQHGLEPSCNPLVQPSWMLSVSGQHQKCHVGQRPSHQLAHLTGSKRWYQDFKQEISTSAWDNWNYICCNS